MTTCKNTVSTTTTKIDKKTGKPIKTYTAKRVCGDEDVIDEDVNDETNNNDKMLVKPQNEFLEKWETMVYPEEPLKQQPVMVDVVVMNTETQQKYVKRVPLWMLEKIPDPQMIRDKLRPDNEITETFRRFLK